MRLRILGPLELTIGRPAVKIGGPRERIVLATMALNANRITSVEHLIDAVWGDDPPSTARGQIQGCISGLRKLFGEVGLPEAINTQSSGYLLNIAADELDSEQFLRRTAEARTSAELGNTDEAAAALRGALDLWRGPALDGIRSDLVQRGAALLDDARLSAIDERVRLDLELGRHEEIVGELRALSADHPLRERLYGFLALAQYRSGLQAEALETCRRARTVLINEMGIEPGQQLRDLEKALLNRDRSLDPPTVTNSTKTTGTQFGSPRQLPSSIADFIGRSDYISDIARILGDREAVSPTQFAVPVVAIHGRGGIGKSTLALRIAHELSEVYPDGHIYVDLHGPDGDLTASKLLARFLRALGVSGSAIPQDLEERAEQYRSLLANKRLLLVLDDVTSADQMRWLLPGSPTCAVILTSRTRLCGLPGAHFVNLDTFDEPTSVQLLARIVGPERLDAEPEAVAELVRYCGGLPLALRIAGARLAARSHWSVTRLARRLKDEVNRLDEFSHQGLELRSSISVTYRALDERTKRPFRLMSLIEAADFPGWTAAALLDVDPADAEDLLESLVDAQVLDVVHGPDHRIRYRYHDLVRVFAREQLLCTETDDERNAALTRLLGAWLGIAERAHRAEYGGDYTILHGSAPRWHVPDPAEPMLAENPLDYLENERAGLVTAIRQAATAGLDELCWDLALSAVSVFEVKGYLDDWRETTQLALDTAVRAGNRTGQAAMLYSLGTLQLNQKRLDAANRSFTEALAIFEEDGDTYGQALTLRNAAVVDRLRGDFPAMLAKYENALTKLRAVGDLIGEANVLRSIAKFRIDEGETCVAAELLGQALELCRRADYRRGVAQVLSRFAELHLRTGQVLQARHALNEVLRTVREIGDRTGEAHALYGLGVVRRREGRLDSAETTLAHALSTAEQVGDRLIEGQSHYSMADIAVANGTAATATEHLERALAAFRELGSAVWQAKSLVLLSEVQSNAGQVQAAAGSVDEAIGLLTGVDSREATVLLDQLAHMRSAIGTELVSRP